MTPVCFTVGCQTRSIAQLWVWQLPGYQEAFRVEAAEQDRRLMRQISLCNHCERTLFDAGSVRLKPLLAIS